LENFLYESNAEDAELKLIDFGFAKLWDPSTLMLASCGSVAYVSPDVICGKGYTSQCDLWSIGVVLWMILTGYPPFHGSEKDMMENVKAGKPDWSHKRRWQPVAPEAVDLVRRLLEKDPEKRLTAQEALCHTWLVRKQENQIKLSRSALRSLSAFSKATKVRRAVLLLLAQELGPEDTLELRQTFLAIDTTSEGTICLRDLKDAIRSSSALSPVKNKAKQDCSDAWSPLAARGSPVSPQSEGEMAIEMVSPARTLRRANSHTLSELFGILDANGDERIYYSDFLAATIEVRSKLQEETVRAAFRRLDADGSGTISASDFTEVLGDSLATSEVRSFLEQMDPQRGEMTYAAFLQEVKCSEAEIPQGTLQSLARPGAPGVYGGC